MATGQGNHAVALTALTKVLNNNVVITVDASGAERVLMGRGLGFGLRAGDTVDPTKVEKTFVLAGAGEDDRVLQLLTDVPYRVIEAVNTAVEEAERTLGRALGRRFTVAVVDHVQFVLERLDAGVRLPTSMPELRVLHPQEFAVASAMAATISDALGVRLPDEEAVFLTMHVLNATRDEPDTDAALLFRRVHHVVATVEDALGVSLDPDSAVYARFVLHVQFLLQRLADGRTPTGPDPSFLAFVQRSYPRSAAVAQRVRAEVLASTGAALADEELLYLTVHVERLAQHMTLGEPPDDVLPSS